MTIIIRKRGDPVKCLHCGKELVPNAKFCMFCGTAAVKGEPAFDPRDLTARVRRPLADSFHAPRPAAASSAGSVSPVTGKSAETVSSPAPKSSGKYAPSEFLRERNAVELTEEHLRKNLCYLTDPLTSFPARSAEYDFHSAIPWIGPAARPDGNPEFRSCPSPFQSSLSMNEWLLRIPDTGEPACMMGR